MIKVFAKLELKENKMEEFRDLVIELIAETRNENGCMTYQLFQDVNKQNVFTFTEEWVNQEALQSHLHSKHFQENIPKLAEIQEKELEINICTLVI